MRDFFFRFSFLPFPLNSVFPWTSLREEERKFHCTSSRSNLRKSRGGLGWNFWRRCLRNAWTSTRMKFHHYTLSIPYRILIAINRFCLKTTLVHTSLRELFDPFCRRWFDLHKSSIIEFHNYHTNGIPLTLSRGIFSLASCTFWDSIIHISHPTTTTTIYITKLSRWKFIQFDLTATFESFQLIKSIKLDRHAKL